MNTQKSIRNIIIYAAIALFSVLFAVFVWRANHPQPTFPQTGIWFCSERNSYIQFNVTESGSDIQGCEPFETGGIQFFRVYFHKDGKTLFFEDRQNGTFLHGTIKYCVSQSPNEFQILDSASRKRYCYVLTDLNHLPHPQRI